MRKHVSGTLAGVAALASATLLAAPAHSTPATTGAFYAALNSGANATVTAYGDGTPGLAGAKTTVTGNLVATAPDGSGYVVHAKVAGSMTSDVFVNAASGKATILHLPATAGAGFALANGAAAVPVGKTVGLINTTNGGVSPLAALPSSARGQREVTAYAPYGAGALVATVDADTAASTGTIFESDLWLVTKSGTVNLASYLDRYFPALAVKGTQADVLGVATANDSVSQVAFDGTTVTDTASAVTVPADTVTADLVFTSTGTVLAVFDRVSGAEVDHLDGTKVASFAAGKHAFISGGPLTSVRSVADKVHATAKLGGVTTGVKKYNAALRPTAAGSATLSGRSGPVPATLHLKAGGSTRTVKSGQAVHVTQNSCFTAAVAATVYMDSSSQQRCVTVQERLSLIKYVKRTDRATFATTAPSVTVQVMKHGRWVNAGTHKVVGSKVTVKVIAKTIRVVAKASATHASATLLVKRR